MSRCTCNQNHSHHSLSAQLVDWGSKKWVNQIFEDWRLLNHIILRHEATIQKKWLKKTRDQRRNTLLHAWPEMPKKHRPDLEVFLEEKSKDPSSNPAYLWPDINQEDLLKSKILLIFLNARARHYPSVFAGADQESFRFGYVSGKIQSTFIEEYTVMFAGHNSPETYGRLYSWSEHPEAINWEKSGQGVQGLVGLLILKVQARVYRFLVDCCLHILQETRKAAMADNTSIEPEPPAISMIGGPVYSLTDIAAAAPYSVPAKLDLGYLRELIAARRSAAEDHVWSLREDPGYFESALLEMNDHRQEHILDINGRSHSMLAPSNTIRYWREMVKIVVIRATGHLEMWQHLLSQVDELIPLLEKYDGQLKVESPLPDELSDAFLDLVFGLEHYMLYPLKTLNDGIPASPPLRSWYGRMPENESTTILVFAKPYVRKDPTQMKLIWLFQALLDEVQRKTAGELPLLDIIERVAQSDPESRQLFTSTIADAIADYSLLAECSRQVNLFQPWASTFQRTVAEQSKKFMLRHAWRIRRVCQVETAIPHIDTRIGVPSEKRFYYPVDKRRTRESTLAMQRAERNLDELWSRIDEAMLKTVNDSKGGVWTCLLSPDRKLQRTPDWVEPAPTMSPMEQTMKKGPKVEDLMQRLELRSESTVDNKETKQPKDKIKTRGTAEIAAGTTVAGELTDETNISSQIDPQPTFKLGKRALKVFSTLFYQPSESSQPGEIPWNEFLHAMRETGFTATKMYGSVWHFTPVKFNLGRSIQFHEPHPTNKIPFNTARRFGRRLFRNYGWRGNMFVSEDPKI